MYSRMFTDYLSGRMSRYPRSLWLTYLINQQATSLFKLPEFPFSHEILLYDGFIHDQNN